MDTRTKARSVALRYLGVVACGLLAPGSAPDAQPNPRPVVIRDEATCKTCTITLRKLARLGSPSDSVDLVLPNSLARDSRGNYYAAISRGTRIGVYSPSGKLIRVIGREGQGPGEFQVASLLSVAADSLVVFDSRQRRFSVFSPAGVFVRGVAMPAMTALDVEVLGSATWMVLGLFGTPGGNGFPLHVVASGGDVRKSFGERQRLRAGEQPVPDWVMGAGTGRSVWFSWRTKYELTRYDETGRMLEIIRREAAWFPDRAVMPSGPDPGPRFPKVGGLSQLSDRHLLVFGTVAREGTSVRTGKAASREDTVIRGGADFGFEMYVEALDLLTKQLILRQTIRPASIDAASPTLSVLGPGIVYSIARDKDGILFIDVWQVVLTT